MQHATEKSYLEQKIEISLRTAWIAGLRGIEQAGPTDRTVRGKAGEVAPAPRRPSRGYLAPTLSLEEYQPPRPSKHTNYHEKLCCLSFLCEPSCLPCHPPALVPVPLVLDCLRLSLRPPRMFSASSALNAFPDAATQDTADLPARKRSNTSFESKRPRAVSRT